MRSDAIGDSGPVGVEVQGPVAFVTLRRPSVLNAINQETRISLLDAYKSLAGNSEIGAIVLRGKGRAFCAGQDQQESASMDEEGAAARIDTYATLYDEIRRCPKPTIAQVHGYAAGAGLQLALLADIRVAASESWLGMTELRVGSAAILGSALLQLVVGEAEMRRLVLAASFISAEESLRVGLVTEVVDPSALEGRVDTLAREIAEKPAMGVALTREWWRAMSEELFRKSVEQARSAHAKNFASGALSEGARNFVTGKQA